jgi:uncharacterized damage-inducible protein DinB
MSSTVAKSAGASHTAATRNDTGIRLTRDTPTLYAMMRSGAAAADRLRHGARRSRHCDCRSVRFASRVTRQGGSMKPIVLLLTVITVLVPTANGAAQPPAMDAATAAKQGFAEVSGWLLKAADMIPPDKYSYRPTATVRTVGEMLGHVADGYNYFCGRAVGQKVEWSDAVSKGKTDKATIVAALKTSTAACTAAHTGKSAGSPLLLSNFGHANLHYGNIVTYMRMLGLVPPSS